MRQRFRLYRRNGGCFYIHDDATGKQQSLRTTDETQALTLLHAKNEAFRQPILNLQMARTYLSATDADIGKRTWQTVMDELVQTKKRETRERSFRAMRDSAFDPLRDLPILETRPEHLLRVLRSGTISTNIYLRRIHNFALDMTWLPWPILNKKQWPVVEFGEKRGVRLEEHQQIIGIEWDSERKAYYELLWHLGGSQSDVAALKAEDIQWQDQVLAYSRKKTKQISLAYFSDEVAAILRSLPSSGPLFPRISKMHEKHRAAEFKRRCKRLRLEGITLHSYRYAWAERAKACGYPERFAQVALGHNSKAVHRAYAKKAQVKLPPLADYEKAFKAGKVIPCPNASAVAQDQPTAATPTGL